MKRTPGVSRAWETLWPFLLGAVVVGLAVLLPWISWVLGRNARAAQARMTDIHATQAALARKPETLRRRLMMAQQDRIHWEWMQRMDVLQRFEWNTYDWRFGRRLQALDTNAAVTLVAANDETLTALGYGDVIPGERYNYIWPRMPVYGRALRELRALGATAVGFDVLLQERLLEEGRYAHDSEFAQELARPGAPAVIALAANQEPDPLFQSRAASVADVETTKDADSVSRRVRAYTDFVQVNPRLGDLADRNGWMLKIAPDRQGVSLQARPEEAVQQIPVDAEGRVPLRKNRFATELVPLLVTNRVWHLGIVLAAYSLKVDLAQSGIESGQLLLRATNGYVLRRIPVDASRYFPVNWRWQISGGAVNEGGTNALNATIQMETLIRQDWARTNHGRVPTNQPLQGRLALVGSTASANNLADRGATPLGSIDFLVGTHLNVANQILANEVIRQPDFRWIALLVGGLAVVACVVTWTLRGVWPILIVLALGGTWFGIACRAFDDLHVILPIIHPIVAGLLIPYGSMVSARAIFEERERRRVRSVFAKMVSPDIVQEMLGSGRIELGGMRRELSVLFADIRGFTALTDRYQAEAEQHVAEQGLSPAAAAAHYDARAREVLETVNLYLGAIADVVKFHHGTLDKYIGDCVMAFWGAPVENPQHAVDCVVAAIDAQRIIARLNAQRDQENERRKALNEARPKSRMELLPLVSLGTGVNSGMVTVGLMGSDAHVVNYTVFGREVNLASRLEGVSGHARIVVGEATYQGLRSHAPSLAALCLPLDPVSVKGFRLPVLVYEVPWRDESAVSVAAQYRTLYQGTPPAGFRVPSGFRASATTASAPSSA